MDRSRLSSTVHKPVALAALVVLTTLLYGGWAIAQSQLDVTIDSGPPPKTTATDATFTFSARGGEGEVRFTCTLDGRTESCSSPKTYSGLAVGGHTFVVEGVDARGNRDQARSQWEIEENPPPPSDPPPSDPPPSDPPPPPPPVPPEERAAAIELSGPAAITFGEAATFAVTSDADFKTYHWDFDSSGEFATDGGSSPGIDHAFLQAGAFRVGVRALAADGRRSEAFIEVTVDRPLLAQLRWSPVHPKPGEKVRFTLDNIHDKHTGVTYFAWRFQGLKPLATSIRLRRGGGAVPAAPGQRARPAATGSGPVTLTSKTADLSVANKFTRKFPKKGVHKVQASVVTPDGLSTTVHASVGVAKKSRTVPPKQETITPQDCALDEELPCPQIGVSGERVTDFPITFDARIPPHAKCFSTQQPKEFVIQQKKDLGYPPSFEGSFEQGAQSAATATRARHTRRRPTARRAERTCIDITKVNGKKRATPWQWDFGDGVKVPAGVLKDSAGAPEVISHVYKKAGTYEVSLTSKLLVQTHPLDPGGQGAAHGSKTSYSSVYLKQKISITVLESYCGTLKLNTIPVTTGKGCFVKLLPPAASDPVYRAFAGDVLRLNGIKIGASGGDFPSQALVSPKHATITAADKLGLAASFPHAGVSSNGAEGSLALTVQDQIFVPAPLYDPELKRKVSESPSIAVFLGGAVNAVGGLGVAGGRVLLSSDQPVLLDLNLALPPVFTGTANVKLQGKTATIASNHDVDFSAELPDVSVGPFDTEGVTIKHRKLSAGGGWYGGGSLGLFGVQLDAPYIPPPNNSIKCAKGGPSGFSLTEDGGFDFAGASLSLPSDIVFPPGIIGMHCLSVSGTKNPFSLQGKVGLRVPPNTDIINLDVCFLIAIMEAGESASGCGKSYTASQAETWLRGAGVVSLFATLDLGEPGSPNAYFDFHKGNDLFSSARSGRPGRSRA